MSCGRVGRREPITIRRGFADLAHGQVHYRHSRGTSARSLLMLHSSPGSSRQLVGLMNSLAQRLTLVAPDTPGNGDSAPHPLPQPEIADYAALLPQFLDAMDMPSVDLFGSHTGAAIAVELALAAPERVGKLIIDGIGVFSDSERDAYLDQYARPFVPDLDGAYLMQAFQFCRDQYLFFPWYARSRAARRDSGLRPAAELHAWLVEVLKANETYPLAYRASFRWPAHARLPALQQDVLLMAAEDDPLFACTKEAAASIARGNFAPLPRFDDPDFVARRSAIIADFLEI